MILAYYQLSARQTSLSSYGKDSLNKYLDFEPESSTLTGGYVLIQGVSESKFSTT